MFGIYHGGTVWWGEYTTAGLCGYNNYQGSMTPSGYETGIINSNNYFRLNNNRGIHGSLRYSLKISTVICQKKMPYDSKMINR